jgi:hypothetical protein
MLRALLRHSGFDFLDRDDFANQVLGADALLCRQGVTALDGAGVARCQAGYVVDPKRTLIQQCGNVACLAVEGKCLCWGHYQERWVCRECGCHFRTQDEAVMGADWRYCFPCASALFHCDECGVSCPDMAIALVVRNELLCATCNERSNAELLTDDLLEGDVDLC